MSTQDQLTSVQTLIANIEANGAAGYTEEGTTWTSVDLAALYRREEQLLRRQAAESGNSFRLGAFIRRR